MRGMNARASRGGAAAKVLVVLLVLVLVGVGAWRLGFLDPVLGFFGIGAAPQAEPLMTSPAEKESLASTDAGGAPNGDAGSASDTGGSSWFGTRLYAYGQLSEDDRAIYDAILASYRSRTEQELPGGESLSNDRVARINSCVMADHPELFYIGSYNLYTLTESNLFGKTITKTILADYLYDEEETKALQKRLDEATSAWIAELPADADDYTRAKHVYERLIETVDYDVEGRANLETSDQTLLSALLDGRAVCAGYSKAFEYLMQAMGIECVSVVGYTEEEAHSWNLALLDGEYYHIDATWGDPLYAAEDEASPQEGLNYDYLCITTGDILKTHAIDSAFELPECTGMADNYYVREGLFVDAPDLDAVARIIGDAAARGESHVRFRCANEDVDSQLRYLLIDDEAVYDLTGTDTIRYNLPSELNTIALWW